MFVTHLGFIGYVSGARCAPYPASGRDSGDPVLKMETQMTASSDWKRAEHIAALLEKMLSPDAKVQHNIFLPVVGRSDRKPRQCDVVVTYGKEPRTSVAIVEVQKRNRKPDINTFHGWVAKMQEVGAQQLICVSEHGYPKSIIDEVALRIGPTVKLMTLRQLEQGDDITQLVMLPYRLHTDRSFEVLSIEAIKLKAEREQIDGINAHTEVSTEDAIFSVGPHGSRLSLNGLVANLLTNANLNPWPHVPESTIDVSLQFKSKHDVWLHSGIGAVHVKEWTVLVRVFFKTTQRSLPNIDTAHLVYQQEFVDGVVAWVATAKIEIEGEPVELRMVFKRDHEGYLTIAGNALIQPRKC